MIDRIPRALLISALLVSLSPCPRQFARASRDHLTSQEADLVREAQELDKRTAVFIKAIERRLLLLTDPAAAKSRQTKKEIEQWGELPEGTRAELLADIAGILDEATNNIDDTSARDARNALVLKSLRLLAQASSKLLAQLEQINVQEPAEQDAMSQAVENARSIVEAASKLPNAPPEEKKGKKSKDS